MRELLLYFNFVIIRAIRSKKTHYLYSRVFISYASLFTYLLFEIEKIYWYHIFYRINRLWANFIFIKNNINPLCKRIRWNWKYFQTEHIFDFIKTNTHFTFFYIWVNTHFWKKLFWFFYFIANFLLLIARPSTWLRMRHRLTFNRK